MAHSQASYLLRFSAVRPYDLSGNAHKYVTGLMLGRILLIRVNELIGERPVICIYAALAIVSVVPGMHYVGDADTHYLRLITVVWRVQSLAGDVASVAVLGAVLGPMYPVAMNECGRVLPRALLTGAIGCAVHASITRS